MTNISLVKIPVFGLVSGKVVKDQGHEGQGQGHKGQGLRSMSICNISIINILFKVKVSRFKVTVSRSKFLRTFSTPSATRGRFH